MLKLKAFTLTSAEALWLKGVREGALPVARRARSDAAGRRTAQLGECQNYFVTMGIQNRDKSCSLEPGGNSQRVSGYRRTHQNVSNVLPAVHCCQEPLEPLGFFACTFSIHEIQLVRVT